MLEAKYLNPSKCNGCCACANICPNNSISMECDSEGFWYPNINKSTCLNCGLCEKACSNIEHKTQFNLSDKAFAAINNNQKVRGKSSSGGIFSVLAEEIISRGGVVFGAAFSDDFKSVRHIAVENKKQLYKLMGSKYLQSLIGDTYSEAKRYLDNGRYVYFSGTPCQIAGLHAFLGKGYDKLITQDIICHGVPSPLVWKKYLEYREKKAKSQINNVSFRNKNSGWKNYKVNLLFENQTEYSKPPSQDLFMRGFLSDIYLRPSCYACGFKSENRVSDITLADFWGIENVCPKMDDDKGTSLILVNTEKGEKIFGRISGKITSCPIKKCDALLYNKAATNSAEIPLNRKKFMQDFANMPFEKVIKKYCNIKKSQKIKVFLKRVVKRLTHK